MAANSHHTGQHHDHFVHDSEDTSDSNEEFASASEGDDDLPWEPVVIRSPVLSRQSPQWSSPSAEQTPQPAHATLALSYQSQPQETKRVQEQEPEQEQEREREQVQEVQESVQSHQRQPSQDALLYDQHHHPRTPQQIPPIHQEHQHSLHDDSLQTGDLYHQPTRSSSSSSWTSQSHSYNSQSHSQSHHFQHEYSSTTITRTRSQLSPPQSQPRGSAPKLRERMRQSPLLHSKIVQAYLDPNASPHRHQQAASDFARQAWLQDGQQESSEDDTEEEEEESLVDQRVPELAQVQSYNQSVTSSAQAAPVVPVVPVVQEFAVAQTTGLNTNTLSQQDQQQTEESWGFNDKIDIEETMQADQMESSWGFDAPIDIDEPVVDQSQPTVNELLAPLEETNNPHIHHVHEVDEVDEDAWGYDDQLADLVKTDIHGIESSPPVIDMDTYQVDFRGDDVDDVEAGEPVVEDKNPFASPEDDLYVDDSSKSLEEDNTRASTTIEDVESVHHTERSHFIDAEDNSHQEKSITPEPKVIQEVHFDAAVDSATHRPAPDEPILDAHSHYSPADDVDDNVQTQSHELHMEGSKDVEAVEEEASWGFDMDEVIDIELNDEAERSTGQHVESYSYNDDIDQQPSSAAKESEVAAAMQGQDTAPDIISAAVEQERTAVDAASSETSPGSDNEHDSEVREILQATQRSPLIESDDGHHSSVAFTSSISEQDHLASSEAAESTGYSDELPHSGQQGESYHLGAPVSSQQSITLEPVHGFKMSAAVPPDALHHSLDFKSTGSDSEGSDIYGDLSTARTGINASSNRLNEILDDDDYLEHMERGLPMNRSISTPYSDEESPKFIVDDHLVELMERGESLPKDGESLSLLEDQDQDQNDTEAEPSFHDHEIDSTNLAASFTLALGASSTVASAISASHTTPRDITVVSEVATPTAPDLYTVFSHHKEKEIMADKESSEIAHAGSAVSFKLEDVTSVATVVDAVSDDLDPANPFSDAAAVDNQEDWPTVNQAIEQQITEHTPIPVHKQLQVEEQPVAHSGTNIDAVIDADWQGSKTEVDVLEAAIDENIQDDTWDGQGLDIVVDSTPAWKEPIMTKEVVADYAGKEEVTDTAAEMAIAREPEPLIDACHTAEATIEVDAWADQDANIVADSLHTREYGGKEELLDDIEQSAEEHPSLQQQESTNSPAAEPEQQATSPSLQTRADQIVDGILASHSSRNPFEADLDEDAWGEGNQGIVFDSDVIDAHPPSQAAVVIQETTNDHLLDLSVTKSQNTTFAIDAEPEKPLSPFNDNVDVHHSLEIGGLDRSIGAVEDEGPWTAQDEDDAVEPVVTVAVIHQAEGPVPAPCKNDDSEDYIAPTFQRLSDQEDTSLSHIIDNALEENAWTEQEVDLTADNSLVTSGHEPTVATTVIKREEVQTTVAIQNMQEPEIDTDLANSIDAAIKDDAWDDQDVNVGTALDFVKGTAPSPKSVTKDDHLGHTSHPDAIQEPHLAQPHMGLDEYKMDIKLDGAIDGAIEEDAWVDQDVDLGVIDGVVHESARSLEFVDKVDHHEHAPTPIPAPDVVQESHMQQSDHGLDIKLGDVIDIEVEDDAWGDQDIDIEITNDIVPAPVQLLESETENDRSEYAPDPESIQELHVPHSDIGQEKQQTNINLSEAINVAIEEDMWADQEMNLTITSELHTTLQSATIVTSVADSHSIPHTHISDDARSVYEHSFEDVVESSHQTSLAACDSSVKGTQVFSYEEPKADILLDDAIDEDAWVDQDLDFAVETVAADVPVVETVEKSDIHSPHSTATTTVIAEPQENIVDETKARPLSSSSPKIGSILQHSHIEQPEEVAADAWGWDEDEVGVHLEMQNETPRPRSDESKANKSDEQVDAKQDSEHVVEKATVIDEASSTSPDSVLAPAVGSPARISPLAIRKDHAMTRSGNSSGDGDEYTASQSPWQDVSPASVSKRSEGGLSIGSGIESEFSVQSLDDDGHVSSKQSGEGNMSWTELKQDEWQADEHHGISVEMCKRDIAGPSPSLMDATAIIEGPLIETQELPDLTGADSWDFDQEDDLMSSFSGHIPISAKTDVSQDLKTPDMDEHRFVPQDDTHSKASHASNLTLSSSHILSSHQSGAAVSVPSSSIQSVADLSAAAPISPLNTTSTPTAATTEVEDDSHLPLAIRQQRARLAARGKPLPPISKYKSTKDTASSGQSSTALSPRLSAPTSPLISSALPDKSPGSPTWSAAATPPPAPEQRFLSPALQKQRERLEKKRAAVAATPLSATRRLTVTEPPTDYTPSSTKLMSPLIAQATLSSALKHTMTSPTLSRKSVQLTTESVSTLSNDDYGPSSRRRGSSVSSHGHGPLAVPSSPLAEGFVSRRSRDVGRPKLMGSQQDTDVVRTSQSNAYRYTSRTSISSSTMSGWDNAFEDEDEDQDASSAWKASTTTTTPKPKERKEPPAPLFTSTSSSSFYQQTVPGLDDDSESRFEASTSFASSTVMASSSGYLSSKKVDEYDPYGPKVGSGDAGKAKKSFEESSFTEHNEVLIGRSSPVSNVSLLSPTSATSISHRHDHHSSGANNSLLGDISSIMHEKNSVIHENRKPASSTLPPSIPSSSSSSNFQKSSSWSFGSWVSSAVAVATDTIDKAYESLDPEYSRMKTRSGHGGPESESAYLGMDDPASLSPYKKPGYVVGGSSLALGLASISAGGPGPASPSQQPAAAAAAQQPQQHNRHASPAPSPPPSASPALGFGSSGQSNISDGGGGYAIAGSASDSHAHHISHVEREQQTPSSRVTRKLVSRR